MSVADQLPPPTLGAPLADPVEPAGFPTDVDTGIYDDDGPQPDQEPGYVEVEDDADGDAA